MIKRKISPIIIEDSEHYGIIGLIGPRQTGKTTLVQALFPEKRYVNLEDPEERAYAMEDPKSFLKERKNGIIIDEFQRVPELLSYIQTITDKEKIPGQFIVTGSQNFLMMEKISQSLAGRISIFTLLPLSIEELYESTSITDGLFEVLYRGLYPRLNTEKIHASRYYRNYVNTYLERDVRLLKNIGDLNLFRDFLLLCAGRAGQLLNYSSLGNDLGISHNTVKSWITVLETSNILYRLRPYYRNFKKQVLKSSKIYFSDTGLLCYLLGIEKPESIRRHFLKGGIFENFVISEFLKKRYNQGQEGNLYFWRDKLGREVDLLYEENGLRNIIEIKAGGTISGDYFDSLDYYGGLDSGCPRENRYVIYGGDTIQSRSRGKVRGWKTLAAIEDYF
jgi:uncharacterized protein